MRTLSLYIIYKPSIIQFRKPQNRELKRSNNKRIVECFPTRRISPTIVQMDTIPYQYTREITKKKPGRNSQTATAERKFSAGNPHPHTEYRLRTAHLPALSALAREIAKAIKLINGGRALARAPNELSSAALISRWQGASRSYYVRATGDSVNRRNWELRIIFGERAAAAAALMSVLRGGKICPRAGIEWWAI